MNLEISGSDMKINYSTTYSSPLGLITMASDGENLIGLWLEGQKYFANNIEESMVENNDLIGILLGLRISGDICHNDFIESITNKNEVIFLQEIN